MRQCGVSVCKRSHRRAVPGKPQKSFNYFKLFFLLSLMHIFGFDSSSHRHIVCRQWPYLKLDISQLWSTVSGVSRCVQEEVFVSRPTGGIPLCPAEEMSQKCVLSSGFRVFSNFGHGHQHTDTAPTDSWECFERHPYRLLDYPVGLSDQHASTVASTCWRDISGYFGSVCVTARAGNSGNTPVTSNVIDRFCIMETGYVD